MLCVVRRRGGFRPGPPFHPDSVPLALLALFAVYAAVADQTAPLWTHIVTGAVLLLAGFGLFAAGALGGGDGKLMAAAACGSARSTSSSF